MNFTKLISIALLLPTFFDPDVLSMGLKRTDCGIIEQEIETIKETEFVQECGQSYEADLNKDLILNYKFDDDFIDFSSNGIDAENHGGEFEMDRNGMPNSAISIEPGKYIEIPNDEKVHVQYPFSISVWGYFRSNEADLNSIINTNLTEDVYHGIFLIRLINGKIACVVGNGQLPFVTSPSNRNNITSTDSAPINEWSHIVVNVYGPEDGEFYINGCKSDVTYSGSGNWDIGYDDNPGVMGMHDSNSQVGSVDNFFDGIIDDFYFWNRTITDEEVLYLYDRFQVPELSLNETYTIPEGQNNITINIPNEYSDVIWSDGQTGNTAVCSEEGTYQVEAFYKCHLVCAEFEIINEVVFVEDCNITYDGSSLENELLLHFELSGNTLDSGPNMIDGVNNGSIATTDRFDDQNAFSFDGNSNIMIPHDDSYKVQFPISVSTWVKWESSTPNKNGVFSTNFEQDNYHGVFMLRVVNTRKIFFGYGTGTGDITSQNRRAVISDMETELNKWYHVVGIINGPNDFQLYIDGCEESFTYTGDENPVIAYNANDGFLGKLDNTNTAPSNDLIGSLDDFYFWNRSITEEEILYLYDRFEVPSIGLESLYTISSDENEVAISLPIIYTDVSWSDGQYGNTATFTEAGIYQVEAYYNCHLVCTEFEVVFEIDSFVLECDQEFDGSLINEMLLLHFDLDNNTNDLSGNGFDGTTTNTIDIENRKGETSSAMGFDGTSQIEIPYNEVLQITYPFAISVWGFFETDISFDNAILSSCFVNNNYHGIIVNRGSTGGVGLSVGNSIGNTGPNNRKSISTDPGLVPLNKWTHIVFNMISPNLGEIYLDGCSVPVKYSGTGQWEIAYTDAPLIIGRSDSNSLPGYADNYLKGALDDFYFWNRSITEEEVLYLYDRFEVPDIELLDSYNFCEDNQVTIEIDPVFENIIWSDGYEGNQRTITETGVYMLEGFYNCHFVCHEFEVIEVPIEISLGEDIVTCEDQVMLSTSVIADWNTGQISNSIIVNQSGVYIASYQSECGNLNDTIVVDLLSNHSISLEETYEFCLGSSVSLSVDNGYESVLWSDGTVGNSVEIFEPGAYQVIGEETVCPSDSHIFIVLVQDTILEIEIDDSILLCDEEDTIITAPSGDYQTTWNGIQDGSSFIAEGDQEVQLTLSNECDEDQYLINVNSVTSETIDQIVKTICRGDSLLLMAPPDAEEYNWSTTDTTSSILITEEGNYSVTYSNQGCVFEAEVAIVNVNSCIDCEYFIPNIISTQSTVGNDEFLIASNHEECLKDIVVSIYDRWGNKMFEGPANIPWDGSFKNKQVTSGVFVVRLTGVFEDASVNITTDLTVIH